MDEDEILGQEIVCFPFEVECDDCMLTEAQQDGEVCFLRPSGEVAGGGSFYSDDELLPLKHLSAVIPKSGFRLKVEENPPTEKTSSFTASNTRSPTTQKAKKGATQKPKKGKTVSRAMKAAKPKDQAPAIPRSRIHQHLAKIDLAALQRDYENPNVSMKQIETSYKLVPHAIARYAGAYAWKRPEKRVK